MALFVVAAIMPVDLLPHDPLRVDIGNRLHPPFWIDGSQPDHLLGTDSLGRDLLSRMIHAARYSLIVVAGAAVLSFIVGVAAGLAAGYFGGVAETIVMRLVDIQLSVPVLVLVIAAVAVLGSSLQNLILVLAIAAWAPYARLVRGVVLPLRELEYIEAAKAIGVSDTSIIVRHLLPNISTVLVTFASFELARLILLESALSFLGLGVQPPDPSWGNMIADGREYMTRAWWVAALPGVLLVSVVLALSVVADDLRDMLDPRSEASLAR